ncbi:putative hydrolase of the HAD superfamily [Kitasatospora sp. MAA4]|uniref:HAD family hydrolase n=1 Tax=Kitasatospora sp. MAA4 TaxID=3035093 RepID=UPI00247528B5|nr:HAD family hydrolase [Kitasatospora sp. MAA4]MDH6136289.1 putative hydrolase of the HAD superfamily [Kitasatospora sp. MAA4]
MRHVRAVLFDIDDTLFDYTGAERAAIVAQVSEEGGLGALASAGEAAQLWSELMAASYQRFLDGELTFRGQQLARARAFVAAVHPGGELLDDTAAAEWFESYRRHYRASWQPFPDAAPTLEALAAHGLRLGLISNASEANQRPKMQEIGLADFFSDGPLICSEEHGEAKPAASIFHAACGELGLPPEQVAYVGDRHDVDAQGARDAGLTGIWLNRSGGRSEADAGVTVIASLTELLPLFIASRR